MKKRLKDKVKITKENMTIELEYYEIAERLNEYCSEPLCYGVEVFMKVEYNNGEIITEGKRIRSLFCKKEAAEKFIDILSRNEVTPTTLKEIAEEYVVRRINVENL